MMREEKDRTQLIKQTWGGERERERERFRFRFRFNMFKKNDQFHSRTVGAVDDVQTKLS